MNVINEKKKHFGEAKNAQVGIDLLESSVWVVTV